MAEFGASLSDAEAQDVFFVKFCMRNVKLTAGVQTAEQFLIQRIGSIHAKTNQVQRSGSEDFEPIVFANPGQEFLGQVDVMADERLQTFDAVMLDDKPEFQRAEAAAERHVPIAVIEDRARCGGLVAQVFRCDTETVSE